MGVKGHINGGHRLHTIQTPLQPLTMHSSHTGLSFSSLPPTPRAGTKSRSQRREADPRNSGCCCSWSKLWVGGGGGGSNQTGTQELQLNPLCTACDPLLPGQLCFMLIDSLRTGAIFFPLFVCATMETFKQSINS